MPSDPLPLRVPNHGPYVENSAGVPAIPGEGFMLRRIESPAQFPSADLTFAAPEAVRAAFVPFTENTHPELGYQVELSYGVMVGPDNWSLAGSLLVQIQARRNSAAAWTDMANLVYTLAALTPRGSFLDGRLEKTIRGAQIPGMVAGDPIEFRGRLLMTKEDSGDDIGMLMSAENGNLRVAEVF